MGTGIIMHLRRISDFQILLCSFFALDGDGALGKERRDPTNDYERRKEDSADDTGSNGERENNLAFTIFDSDFADITLFDESFDFADYFFAFDFEFFLSLFTYQWFLNFLFGGHMFTPKYIYITA